MAQRALNADGLQRSAGCEESLDPDDGVELEKRDSHCRVVQVDGTSFDLSSLLGRKRVEVDLQADCERCSRTDAGTDAAERGSFNRTMEFQRVSPEGLIAERIESKRLPAVRHFVHGIRQNVLIRCLL